MAGGTKHHALYDLPGDFCYNRMAGRQDMKITDIDLTNTIAIAQFTTALIIVAFLLLFLVSKKESKDMKSSHRK